MKLHEIHDQIDADLVIDKTELGDEALKNPKLFTKYLRIWSDEKMKMEIALIRIEALIQQKRDYYAGNGTPEEYKEKPFDLKIKTEAGLNKYINGDADVIKEKEKIIIQEQKVKVLEKTLAQIKDRGFSIKHAIDHHKFLEGY